MISTKMLKTTVNVNKRCAQTLTSKLDPVQDKAMSELCILVNDNDVAMGHASKRDCHFILSNNLPLHRAFSVFLFNSKNQLLIQKRSSTKITFPKLVSNTCCSHPLYDIKQESDMEDAIGVKLAAQRRLNFELGIPLKELDPNSMHYLTRIHYRSFGDGIWGEHEIDYILIMQEDVTLNPNPDEVSDLFYVSQAQMKELFNDPKLSLTPWFKYLVASNMLSNWWANLHQLDKITDVNKIHRLLTI